MSFRAFSLVALAFGAIGFMVTADEPDRSAKSALMRFSVTTPKDSASVIQIAVGDVIITAPTLRIQGNGKPESATDISVQDGKLVVISGDVVSTVENFKATFTP